MVDFFVNNWEQILLGLIAIVVGVCTFVRTGSASRASKEAKEILLMKYKTSESNSSKGQTFSEERDDYVLNPETNELELLETKVNIQALIQSYAEQAFDKVLERFLPGVVDETESPIDNYENAVRDLSVLGEAMETAEFYRDEFGLPDNYSMAQIYAEVDKKAQEYKGAIGKANAFLNSVQKEKNKEVENGTVSSSDTETQNEQA